MKGTVFSMVLAQMCHNFCDAAFQSKCVTIILQETCQNGIQEAAPIGLLLKGVCLQQVIKAGVNMVKM